MNTASASIPVNFVALCESTLERYAAAAGEEARRAVLDRDTVQGLRWAIDFCKSIKRDLMTEAELRHAVRLTTFRGRVCPVFRS